MEKQSKKRTIIRISISILVIALIVIGVYFLFKHLGFNNISKEKLRDYISSTGPWAPLVFILISFLQVTFIPIPSSVTILAGSFLFGPGLSFLYSYIGILLGSFLAFFLGRIIGKPFVNWIVGDKETVEKYLKKLKGKETVLLFFMFLLPFFPDDALCAIAGILPISWPVFIAMQLISRATSIFGNILFLSGEFIPYNTTWGIVTITILSILGIVAFIFCYKYSEQIQTFIINFISKHSKKNKNQKNDKNDETK